MLGEARLSTFDYPMTCLILFLKMMEVEDQGLDEDVDRSVEVDRHLGGVVQEDMRQEEEEEGNNVEVEAINRGEEEVQRHGVVAEGVVLEEVHSVGEEDLQLVVVIHLLEAKRMESNNNNFKLTSSYPTYQKIVVVILYIQIDDTFLISISV